MSAQRYATREKAAIQFYGKDGALIADLKNISTTGACIEWKEADIAMQEGDLIRMTIILKAIGKKHNVSAEVVWVEGKVSGVNFIKTKEVLEKIADRF